MAQTKEGTIAKKARIMPTRDMATEDLFGYAFAALTWLRALMQRRAKRDAACQTLTNLSVGVQYIGQRLASLKFDERAVSLVDEEDEEKRKRKTEATLADLFEEPDADIGDKMSYIQGRFCDHCKPELDDVLCEECRDALGSLCGHQERLRRQDFTIAMTLFCKGARNIEEVAKRVVTTMQATMPGLLQDHFGVSLSSVGGRMGEGRQTTQARKKRLVEGTQRRAGAKGYKGLGGARSEQHRKKCAEAQKGNESRAKGEASKRSR